MPASADVTGWRTFAATGWFMGDHTPFERVYAVPAGTQVGLDARHGRIERQVDVLATWAAPPAAEGLSAHRVDALAGALQGLAQSLGRMWHGPIVADLSGGRDSRLVVAAFLSAGVDVELQTNDAEAGEGVIAKQLVAALPHRVAHRVTNLSGDRSVLSELGADNGATPTVARALGWHRQQEGLRPATYLPTRPPEGFRDRESVAVGGAAGEIAHGYYYPSNFADLATLPYRDRVGLFLDHLIAKVVRRPGISSRAQDAASWQVQSVLLAALKAGLDDAKVYDYFYAAERLRRWGTTAEAKGIVTPLLVPEFIRAAFELTPLQRHENALHRAVTARLIPAWAEVPYYERPRGETAPALRPRLGFGPDHETISVLVADPELWADEFDVPHVQHAWQLLRSGEAGPSEERLLQRVIWRSVFADYLAELNGGEPPARKLVPPASTPVSTAPSTVRLRGDQINSRVLQGRDLAARALRKAARIIDPA